MTKAGKRIVIDSSQLSLFDFLKQEREERQITSPGRMCCSARLMAAVKLAIKNAPMSRETLADKLTDLTGADITIHMINSYCSDAHPHRLPAEYLPALCHVTNSTEPIRILAELAGLYTLPAPDALRAEIQKLDEETKRLQKERQKRLLFLHELEEAQ